jgi:16S rRNA (cytosine1402-N4)-methyltransferase
LSEDARHIPVMLDEVVAALAPARGQHIVDGTFGAGGYSRALLDKGAQITGFDRDPDVVRDAAPMLAEFEGKLELIEAPFSAMGEHFGRASVDGVVLDIGVSSMQIDEAERGFSFQKDGPLDMRMAQSGLSAADVVNTFSVSDLTRIVGILGEERHAGRVARAIEKEREAGRIETTAHLARIVEKAVGRGPKDKIHPATRTFQGLRIFVNDELGELGRALFAAETYPETGRAAGRGHLPFAGGPHRQALLPGSHRRFRRVAPHAGSRREACDVPRRRQGDDQGVRRRSGAQPTRPLGQAARRHPHGRTRSRR